MVFGHDYNLALIHFVNHFFQIVALEGRGSISILGSFAGEQKQSLSIKHKSAISFFVSVNVF